MYRSAILDMTLTVGYLKLGVPKIND
jgi:hypothetical protein